MQHINDPCWGFLLRGQVLNVVLPWALMEWLSLSALPLDVLLWAAEVTRSHKNSFRQKDGSSQIKKIWYSHTCSSEEQITLLLLFWTLYQKRMLCKRMTSQPDANQRQTSLFFFSFNCINSFICDRAYWWAFVFKLSTGTLFYWRNSLDCFSLLAQRTASFDHMIKAHPCFCKTHVYWICFIAIASSLPPRSRRLILCLVL